jgi:hypothetical protein
MSTKEQRAAMAYDRTKRMADRNALAGAASGVFGMGVNWIVDVAAIPFYTDLWNDIRGTYGKGSITLEAARRYLKPNIMFLVQDFVVDKILGAIPIFGIRFNYICAKALTWRLGAWFAVLSALGEEKDPSKALIESTMELTRRFFPANQSILDFEEPSREQFIEFIAAVDGLTQSEAAARAKAATEVWLRGVIAPAGTAG